MNYHYFLFCLILSKSLLLQAENNVVTPTQPLRMLKGHAIEQGATYAGFSPVFSSSGEMVVFSMMRKDLGEIYAYDLPKGQLTELNNSRAYEGGVKIPPSGEWVYFISEREDVHTLYRMNLNGSSVERVLPDDRYIDSYSIDPSGGKLLFSYKVLKDVGSEVEIVLWDLENRKELLKTRCEPSYIVGWLDNTSFLYATAISGKIRKFSTKTLQDSLFLSLKELVLPKGLSPCKRYLIYLSIIFFPRW